MDKKFAELIVRIDDLKVKAQATQKFHNKPYAKELDKMAVGCMFIGRQMLFGYAVGLFFIGLGIYEGWKDNFSDPIFVGVLCGIGAGLIIALLTIRIVFVHSTKKRLLKIKKEISKF